MESHPLRMRGLKRSLLSYEKESLRSHPLRMRGLKRLQETLAGILITSHPLRMRGLKPEGSESISNVASRILYGCVD